MAIKDFKTKQGALNFRDKMRAKGYAAFDYDVHRFGKDKRTQVGATIWRVQYSKLIQ